MNQEQLEKMRSGRGFVAALDQSGGSTPKALRLYGVAEGSWASEAEMFDLIHQMRTRIFTSPSFGGDRIIGTILFEQTMDRDIEGRPAPDYVWEVKGVVPFVKVDRGLEEEADGARLMKPMPGLADLLARARARHVFGTKMRSVILRPGAGLQAVVDQQFEVARTILAAGLVPIIEPEVDIHSPAKGEAEEQLHAALREKLDALEPEQYVMLKLTPPETDDLYADLVAHPRVLRVVFLSGGYSREEANARLARNHGVVASFSRALTEGLGAGQSQEEFDATLDASIASIAAASAT
ncbi:MAG TPA: fructose bisphosphate aldolase [Nocardioides sp.]|uniref:fructose bisphosphate aldolase n=1 Tax=Nocardioides sp. TaxID=35761 RepID=UPI002B632CF8|nr:fructose bisphosphate aldolase [Nocardioides sp.]HQR28209.1 fructose bisphosphate aldolase [Nocardioides sp.]